MSVIDNLDSMTAAELDELFAVEVCGTLVPIEPTMGEARAYHDTRTGAYRNCKWRECFTDFSTDANSVLPWLEKQQYWSGKRPNMPYHVTVHYDPKDLDECQTHGMGDTFARAAVVALIRAARAVREGKL